MTETTTESRVPQRRKATKVGIVVSNKMEKSVTVKVERFVKHKLYKRYIRKAKKFMAHDELNDCRIGDQVEIIESRPLSANKRWRVRKILRRAAGSTPSETTTATAES